MVKYYSVTPTRLRVEYNHMVIGYITWNSSGVTWQPRQTYIPVKVADAISEHCGEIAAGLNA